VNTLLHATVYMFLHNLLNLLVQNANKIGLRKKMLAEVVFYQNTITIHSLYGLSAFVSTNWTD
jgi:hypothetical protein